MLRDRAQNQPVGCFRHGVAQRAGQRANCVISNRLPRLLIRACSALVRTEKEQFLGFIIFCPTLFQFYTQGTFLYRRWVLGKRKWRCGPQGSLYSSTVLV